ALAEAEQAEKARKNEQAAVTARDKLETALARSLLRPLGQTPRFPPTDPEIEALWELTSQQSETRRRFVSEALQKPVFTRQLLLRAKLALHAVVGLDTQQREVVEKVLLEGLQEGKAPEEQQIEIALVITLGDPSPPAAATAARVFARAMGKTSDPSALSLLARGLAAVAPRLEPGEAARTLTQAMSKATHLGTLIP